ncbi:SDR family oxidoreductase [Amycolatopsis rhabdoformis]|uniref:SDR family oxidoreductase n=1 Tax=Amycolatopsis rhabdoformis TaxID=1448059 RepID=A0ABZ1IDR5_9PSEU|nr:SDR family oxidoreductase [Amycolatopsis rhabdoformis]WSE32226.1 SDR family oxidoreductase [Amycolatopsis rhabdoformis]
MATRESAADAGRELAGRQVVVTGAARGLGRAYAEHLAKSGADVLVNDIDRDEVAAVADELARWGTKIAVDSSSVDSWEGARSIVDTCVGQLGGISGLVNNAGIAHFASVFEDEPAAVERLLRVNVLGTFFVGMQAMRAMRGTGGSVVNITSGAQAGGARIGAYAASKGAVSSATYSWALEGIPAGIRVNAVAPEAATRMNRLPAGPIPDRSAPHAQPEHVAPLVTYLISERARRITGQVVRLAGTSLTVMSHPALTVVLDAPVWTIEAVERALAGPLAEQLQPLGHAHRTYDFPLG